MVRDYLVCKHARLLLLAKKWDRIEKQETKILQEATKSEFQERMRTSR
jgi:hypothetical protein